MCVRARAPARLFADARTGGVEEVRAHGGKVAAMVQMHPPSPSTTGISFEVEGGIRNPACQDEDTPGCKSASQQQQQQHHRRLGDAHDGATRLTSKKIEDPCKIQEKSRELKEVMTVCHTRIPWRFSGNFFIAIIVTAVMILGELGFIPNQKIGFYCNDPKISFKFEGDSISAVTLMMITIALPALVIWATEWSCYKPESYKSLESGSCSRSRQFWQWYGEYTLGWLCTVFIVEIVKVIVGEPRPHFFDSCRPTGLRNCSANEYRKWYTCTNTEISWIYVKDSDKSFPSGHSALAMFLAVFLICYLQRRMPNRVVLILVKPWLQCLAVLWGLGCSLSRISDNRHHWWDVAVGGVLGTVFAVFVVRVHCKGFRPGGGLLDLECPIAQSANGPLGYADPGKRHQSVKKLLSNSSSADAAEGRELGDMPATWTA